jgi:hypothetical protein
MRIKKLTAIVIMAVTPFGAATGTGTAPYGNDTMLGTAAAINPYVLTFFAHSRVFPSITLHISIWHRRSQCSVSSAHVTLTRVLEQWIFSTPQTTTPHPAE